MTANVAVLLLAAGASSRMGGIDKLTALGTVPMLRRAAEAALDSKASGVIVVLAAQWPPRREALHALPVAIAELADASGGMAASIRAGLALAAPDCGAVIIGLADMPGISAAHYDALIAAFDPAKGRDICRATSASGRPGHPVLFGRRHFPALAALQGDRGARSLLANAGSAVVNVPTAHEGAVIDIDTPQDWDAWRGSRS